MDLLVGFRKNKMDNMLSAYQHPPSTLELELAKWMLETDKKKSREVLNKINSLERAYLSDVPIQSLQYSLICGCTCYTRTAIKGGVDSEIAFDTSDRYIMKIGKTNSIAGLKELAFAMLDEFIDLIQSAKEQKVSSSPIINQLILYIHANIHRRITLGELAEQVHLHPSYVSQIFRREVGCGVSEFITANKILLIQKFLTETDLKMVDIAMAFEFSSAAHFSTFFKKHTGMMPRAYRSAYSKNS